MNGISNRFREALMGLPGGGWITEAMDGLSAGIVGVLRKEHKDGGEHGDVTADSIAVTGETSVGPLTLMNAVRFDIDAWFVYPIDSTLNNWDHPGVQDAAGVRFTNTGGPGRTITGIVARSPQAYRILFIQNGSASYNVTLAHLSASSSEQNRFAFMTAADYVLQPGGLVMLVYDPWSAFWRGYGFS
jgi:hypothetical protein